MAKNTQSRAAHQSEPANEASTEVADSKPAYDGPPIEHFLDELTKAESNLEAALVHFVGRPIMYKGLPHQVQARDGKHFLRCMVSKKALEAMKENGLMR